MELYINGKSFCIEEKLEKTFAHASEISRLDNCLEIYMKDDDDSNFDAIVFMDLGTGDNEIVYVSFLRKAINDPLYNFRRLFLSKMIVNTVCFEAKMIDLPTLLSIDSKVDITDTVLLPKDDILYVYIPSVETPPVTPKPLKSDVLEYVATSELRKNLSSAFMEKEFKKEAPKPVIPPVEEKKLPTQPKENIFTKKLSPSERRSAVLKYLGKDEDSVLLFALLNKSIYRINKLNGEAKPFTLQSLIDNPLLDIDSIDDVLSLGIFDLSIKKPFKFVSCCDIRLAFPHFDNAEAPVVGINYTVDENILYIVFAPEDVLNKGLTLKQYSIESYKKTGPLWEQIEEKFETYNQKIFYVHRNNLPDCIALCKEDTKTTEFKSLEDIAEGLENFSLNMNTDLSVGFPKERIFDLNIYGTDDVKLIRMGSMNVINACDIKEIRDSDECSTGYDKKNNVCFYCMPKY